MCTTFNHAPYITDTLNGFTNQETTFPYVCCIIDDASVDGEQVIIQKYFDVNFDYEDSNVGQRIETNDYILSFARHKTNINCYFLIVFLKYNHYRKKDKYQYISKWYESSKYMAFCEGDDYWINSNKLQKQYSILENNTNCSMCCHNAIILYTQQHKIKSFNEGISEGIMSPKTVIDRWSIPTASFFIRSECYKYPDWLIHIYSADIALYLRCLNAGEIYYINEFMSVYRINTENNSESARMKGREIYILEQHNILLDSFNKGTTGRFDKEIKDKINSNKALIRYYLKRQKGLFFCLFEPVLYKKIISKYFRTKKI